MTPFDQQRLIETVLYILNNTGGLDQYHIFKVLYLAERSHLAEWGESLVPDTFRAFKHGPVPAHLYFTAQGKNHKSKRDATLLSGFKEAISPAGDDAQYILLANRQPNMDYLSEADVATLDNAIEHYANMSFAELERIVHNTAWKAAYHGDDKRGEILSPVLMAKEAGATDGMLQYIQEQLDLDQALS